MKIVSTIAELQKALSQHRAEGKKIGFVPTMGALHKGHISLINIARAENDKVVCSIFVNPTQFNDPKDLERYPRPLEEDEKMLNNALCDVLFIPSVHEMYPNEEYSTLQVDFGNLDKVMEGKARPGHFAGMITIVSKLFDAVKPHNAYFGSKDFQQLTLVKYFVEKYNIPIAIKSCPIVRDSDGLAMSSRNRLLSAEEREHALQISRTLFKVKEMWSKDSVAEIKQFVTDSFVKDGFLRLDYFEIVYADILDPVKDTYPQPLSTDNEGRNPLAGEGVGIVACVAAFAGKIRLIDNVVLIP